MEKNKFYKTKYYVTVEGCSDHGLFERITDAYTFAEALVNKYYAEPSLKIIIEMLRQVDGDKHE